MFGIIIAKPGTWAQTATAFGPSLRGAGLLPCSVTDPEARSFCAAGALMKAFGCDGDAAYSDLPDAPDREGGEYCEAIRHLASVSDDYDPEDSFIFAMETLTAWNDDPEREHGEVLAAYDRAIDFADSDVTRGILRKVRELIADPVNWSNEYGMNGRLTLGEAMDAAVGEVVPEPAAKGFCEYMGRPVVDGKIWDQWASDFEEVFIPVSDAIWDIVETLPGNEIDWETLCEFGESQPHSVIIETLDAAIDRL